MEVLQRTANRGSVSTGYDIDNSLKLEPDNSESLTRSAQDGGDRKKVTLSFWCKRTELSGGAYQMLFLAGVNSNKYTSLGWGTGDEINFHYYNSGSYPYNFLTVRKFRDTSAFYHIVVAIDTTQSTDTDRVKFYVNGVEETSLSTNLYPNQNIDTPFNNDSATYPCEIGNDSVFSIGGNPLAGYLADYYLIDGSQLAPTEFGEFDEDSGIWKPKAYTGTFGNNGFYLDFADASDLGDDESGNGNDFTEVNITAADQATDTPTNNGCTLNVLASLEGSNDITEGALVSTGKAGGGGNFNGTYGTMGIDPFNSTVDWYWEIEASSTTNGSSDDIGIGWIKESRITSGSTIYSDVYGDGISRYSSQTATSAGDIWGVLLETGTTPVMKLYRNDGLIHTSTHGSGGVSFDTLMFPYITVKGTGTDARLNFLNPASSFSIASGNTDPNGYGNFEFDPKGGYALCTKNLAEYG